jgi:hypothetical protein
VVGDVRAHARGRALLGPLRYVKERHGKSALDKIVASATPGLRSVLDARIKQSTWYPYEAYVSLLRAIDRTVGNGDLLLCRTLGEWAGAQDLGSMFKVYALIASADRLIRSCKLVWPQYYDRGEMTALSTAPEDTRLRIVGFPEMDPAHCRLMEGWMIATMGQIGCRVQPGGRETTCPSRGGDSHEFSCTWIKS